MININGVLYKSTSRKLEKTSTSSLSKLSLNPSEKMLSIRGEKFILDMSGRRLKRESESSSLKMSRIDIGGLTYKASRSGAFERDNSHQIRSHLRCVATKLLRPKILTQFIFLAWQKPKAFCCCRTTK